METSAFDFGIAGLALMVVWRLLGFLDQVAKDRYAKKNGHPHSPCTQAVRELAAAIRVYVDEDRLAHKSIVESLALQRQQIDELHKVHLGQGAIDPTTGTPRWWGKKEGSG